VDCSAIFMITGILPFTSARVVSSKTFFSSRLKVLAQKQSGIPSAVREILEVTVDAKSTAADQATL